MHAHDPSSHSNTVARRTSPKHALAPLLGAALLAVGCMHAPIVRADTCRLAQVAKDEALVQVPAYVSRIGESLRAGDRANLLDQADELRMQSGADWVLITDQDGILKAWSAHRALFDEDFARGALIGRALEGQPTEGLWLEPGEQGDELYQAVGVPVASPGVTRPLGIVVAAVRHGLLRRDEVIERYGLSEEEFDAWSNAVETHGPDALKITQLQKFKQL